MSFTFFWQAWGKKINIYLIYINMSPNLYIVFFRQLWQSSSSDLRWQLWHLKCSWAKILSKKQAAEKELGARACPSNGYKHICHAKHWVSYIRNTVRQGVSMMSLDFCSQNNGEACRDWNGVRHQERPPGGLLCLKRITAAAYHNTNYKRKQQAANQTPHPGGQM